MTLTVDRIKRWEKGSTLGFMDINVEGYVTIKGFKVMKNKKGDLFISVPSTKSGDKFYNDVKFSAEAYKRLQEIGLKAFQESTN